MKFNLFVLTDNLYNLHVVPRLRIRGTIRPLLYMPSCLVKHSDNLSLVCLFLNLEVGTLFYYIWLLVPANGVSVQNAVAYHT